VRQAIALALALALGTALSLPSAAQSRRLLTVDDLFNLQEVRDPQRSPDGKWVAYTVTRAIRETDKNDTDVWMVSWDGTRQIQLTFTPDDESRPRWSPDGRFLSFVSSRHGARNPQVWLMNRLGGEAVKITDVSGAVLEYAWSPDGTRLVLVVQDPDPGDPAEEKEAGAGGTPKTPRPIVIDRY